MTFAKIKFDGKQVTLVWDQPHGDVTERHTLESKDAPRPAFEQALAALADNVAEVCELDMDRTRLTVRGVSLSEPQEGSEDPGVTLTASYALEHSSAPLLLNTPHQALPNACARLEALFDEARRYVRGERAQATLFTQPEEVMDLETGEIHEAAPAPRRPRAAGSGRPGTDRRLAEVR